MNVSRPFLIWFIIFIFCLIFTAVLLSVSRRLWNKRRYEKLDRLREILGPTIKECITTGSIDEFVRNTKIPAGSLEWDALEQVLLEMSEQEENKTAALQLFKAYGHDQYYQKQLSGASSSIKLSAAADKLGRIGDSSAIPLLAELLQHKEAEVVTVAFRALCRIGSSEALNSVLNPLPVILKDRKVAVKAIQTSLLLFKPWVAETLLQYAGQTEDPEVLAVMIETLIAFPVSSEILQFALSKLSHTDPEVRAKALRMMGREEIKLIGHPYDPQVLQPLLNDSVWFVRLQAARTIEISRCDGCVEMLKKLVLDEQWQVRDAATTSLINMGDDSVDVFLDLLETTDRFAKESIAEAIERTVYRSRLIEWLGSFDHGMKIKALRILTLMDQIGFSIPMQEAMEAGYIKPDICEELTPVLQTGGDV